MITIDIETDRAETPVARPQAEAAGSAVSADPIPESHAGAATFPHSAAAGDLSPPTPACEHPAGRVLADGGSECASCGERLLPAKPDDSPLGALSTEGAIQRHTDAIREHIVADLEIPAHLRIGSPENDAIRRKHPRQTAEAGT